MEQEFRKWDDCMIEYKTNYNQRRVEYMREKLIKYDNDKKHIERTDNQECKACNYIDDNLYFQAFTDTHCGICGKKMTFCNSDTDKVCLNCAIENGLCKHCGGRMD